MGNDVPFEGVTLSLGGYRLRMNPKAIEIMREALEKISSIHKPTKDPVENTTRRTPGETGFRRHYCLATLWFALPCQGSAELKPEFAFTLAS